MTLSINQNLKLKYKVDWNRDYQCCLCQEFKTTLNFDESINLGRYHNFLFVVWTRYSADPEITKLN